MDGDGKPELITGKRVRAHSGKDAGGLEDPVMVFVPRGRGGALVIGDSQFLLNSNLEGLDDWHPGNIMFLRELFERLKTPDAGSFDLSSGSSGLSSLNQQTGGPE